VCVYKADLDAGMDTCLQPHLQKEAGKGSILTKKYINRKQKQPKHKKKKKKKILKHKRPQKPKACCTNEPKVHADIFKVTSTIPRHGEWCKGVTRCIPHADKHLALALRKLEWEWELHLRVIPR
jgi:hypothetical protein